MLTRQVQHFLQKDGQHDLVAVSTIDEGVARDGTVHMSRVLNVTRHIFSAE